MNARTITSALRDIADEKDPALRSQKLASLCSAVFRERGIELVVVGGSAIEFYTEGAYTSGDVDLCLLEAASLPLRLRQELMGQLRASGGPRSWRVAGMFVDLLGPVEMLARTPVRRLAAPYGVTNVAQPEELLVERALISVYPQPNAGARATARKLLAVALRGQVKLEWDEVWRLAKLPEYRILPECKSLVCEVARELKIQSPPNPD